MRQLGVMAGLLSEQLVTSQKRVTPLQPSLLTFHGMHGTCPKGVHTLLLMTCNRRVRGPAFVRTHTCMQARTRTRGGRTCWHRKRSNTVRTLHTPADPPAARAHAGVQGAVPGWHALLLMEEVAASPV